MHRADHAVWWHVYPLGFAGAPVHGAHTDAPRLRRLIAWLDYAVDLGASGLLLGPVFASQTHGYDTLDHHRIDPRLGTDGDLDDLVAACRARGLRLVLDGVFSHVGRRHPALLRALRDGPGSADAALFDIDWDHPGGPSPRVFEGHDGLARLDHRTPRTAAFVGDVLAHWLDRGIDGWRLDAAYSVDPAFWATVLPPVRRAHPAAWILGEVIHGDYPEIVRASGMDSVTQYELWKAIWSSIADRNLFELDWALQRHTTFLEAFVPQTFVGNHDVTRVATRVGPEGALVALVVLMTVGGIPSVYSGDEQAFTGLKEQRQGGDDAVRPAFPDRPDELAPWGAPTYRAHQDLIGLRRRHPWLTTARTQTLHLDNTRHVYRSRSRDGWDHLDIEIDLSGATPAATVRDAAGDRLWHTPGRATT